MEFLCRILSIKECFDRDELIYAGAFPCSDFIKYMERKEPRRWKNEMQGGDAMK